MAEIWKTLITLVLVTFIATLISATTAKIDEKYRLSPDHIPSHYIVNLTITEATYYGRTQIHFQTVNDTSEVIKLHFGGNLIIDKIVLDFVDPVNSSFDAETEILTVFSKAKIIKGEHTLTIDYVGSYPEEEFIGLYKTVFDNNGVNNWYVSTQFEPTYARRAFPCFDEPGFKATFDLIVIHPIDTHALANTPILNTTYTSDSVISRFKTTPLMATYTAAIVVSTLAKSDLYPSTNKSYEFNVYSRSNVKKYTGTAAHYGPMLIDFLASWTGIKYEDMGNTQLDQVAVRDFGFGAMENWGLVIYRELYLLDEGETSTNLQKQKVITTMAHELAHQWFGNLVTLDWWSDAWLNEGFATYCQYYIPGASRLIDMSLDNIFTTEVTQVALNLDAYPTSPPLSSKGIETQNQDLSKFDAITYKKGGSLVRMMRSILGNKFQTGVQNYLKDYSKKNANPTKLLKEFNKIFNNSKYDFEDLMHNWIYKFGYPVLNVALSDDKKTATVTQEQFLYTSDDDVNKTQWYVPISYTTSEEKKFNDIVKTWLEPNATLKIDMGNASWIMLNMERTGFYRVNYAPELLDKLIAVLKSKNKDDINVLNRAQLVDDIFAFARAGLVKYERAFQLLEFLQNETEYQPWVSAFRGFSFLLDKFVDDDDITKLLKIVVLNWLNTAFKTKTLNPTHIEVIRNSLVTEWKCKTGHEECLKTANQEYAKYKKDYHVTDNNDRDSILCYGFRNSKTPVADYKFLLDIYTNTDSVVEASSIMTSISCSENKDVISMYLKELGTKIHKISRQDTIDVYRGIISNKKGIDLALDFVLNNLQNIIYYNAGIISVDDVITGLADRITTTKQLEILKSITDTYSSTPGMKDVADQAAASANTTINWIKAYNSDVKTILKKYDFSGATSLKATYSVMLCGILMIFVKSW